MHWASTTDLVLRKVINFSDCTVCLDKRNASGKIEFYQDPLLYKCSFRTRLHFTYDNLNSKMPSVIKSLSVPGPAPNPSGLLLPLQAPPLALQVTSGWSRLLWASPHFRLRSNVIHTLVESLKLSITDQQLPMFIRIMQLGIALYYGEIGNVKDGETEDFTCHNKDTSGNITVQRSRVVFTARDEQSQDGYHGPGHLCLQFYDDGEEDYLGNDPTSTMHQQKSQTLKDPIVSIGFYCTKATVTFKIMELHLKTATCVCTSSGNHPKNKGLYYIKIFLLRKLTEMQAESSYYSPQKVTSKEVLCWEQEGTTIEALMMGEPFFDCQIGFVGCRAMCLKGIMGVKDFEENMNRSETEACFFICGENLSMKGLTYLTNSLFDYRSPENNGTRAEFILDATHHKETYTEIAGMQRFGAFYMDYLYTMENNSGQGSANQQDFSLGKSEDLGIVQEKSTKSLVIGPLDFRLDSSAVHRILKMIVCALEHEYEPYSGLKP
ncbi:LOW QUALITY PROTEIN: hypothetical protein QTO34_007621, partial [Cnephaeus nilssonii]